jgi:hypothetical protein
MTSSSGSVHTLPYCFSLFAEFHGMEDPVDPRLKPANSKRSKPLASSLTSLSIWVDPEMEWYGNPDGTRGRSQTFSDAAIDFCLTVARVFGLSLRRAIEQTKSFLKTASLDWKVPDYSTLSRRKKQLGTLAVDNFRNSGTHLHLLVHDRGVSVSILLNGAKLGPNHPLAYERNWRMLNVTLKNKKATG